MVHFITASMAHPLISTHPNLRFCSCVCPLPGMASSFLMTSAPTTIFPRSSLPSARSLGAGVHAMSRCVAFTGWLLVGLGAITLRLGAAQPYPFCSSSLAIVDTITLSAAAGPGAYQELFTATCPSSGFGSVYTIYYGTTATGAVASTLYSSVASATIPCNGTTVTTYTYPAAGTFTVRLHSCPMRHPFMQRDSLQRHAWHHSQHLAAMQRNVE